MVPDNCLDRENFLFVQYTCVHDTKTMYNRYNAICAIAFTSILMAFIFLIWTRYSEKGSNISVVTYDLATVTAADYTIHVNMANKPNQYKDWYKGEYLNGDMLKGISPAISLKQKLVDEIKEIVQKQSVL
jgi:hypothetical protein